MRQILPNLPSLNVAKRFKLRTLVVAGFALAACATVTVNVNFPESAVQKATDDYVRELYRAKNHSAPETSLMHSIQEWIIPSAYAAEGEDFTVNSPKALKIRDRLAALLDDVISGKKSGNLGEANDGYLVVRGKDKLKPLLLKKYEKLTTDENSIRKELYEEVLKSNGFKSSDMEKIQRSFARSFQKESPSGTWIQNGDGRWDQKS